MGVPPRGAPQPQLQSANPPEMITVQQWAGMNQDAPREQIGDDELYWSENFFPIAPGNLRTAWGPSAPIYTAPGGATILRMFFGQINSTTGPIGLMFLSTGQIDQVQLNPPNAVTTLGAPVWTPQAPNYYASAKLWKPTSGTGTGQGGFLIGSPLGLYAWDGTTLTGPGQTAPVWLTNGQVATMPSGLPGIYAMEVYQERLWVAGQTTIAFSAPTNAADFAPADGGGAFYYFGDQLTASYTDLAAGAGFLYVFGDSMINNVAYVQLQGQGTTTSPYITTFFFSNVDPQNGQWPFRPVARWGNQFIMYNGSGAFLLSGTATAWISEKLRNLTNSNPATVPSVSKTAANIFGSRWCLFNGQFTDPWNVTRNLILCWNGKIWTVASQRYNLTEIGSFEQNSVITPYGTDGTRLYQLFAQPDPALTKRLSTKTYRGNILTIKNWRRVYLELRDNMPVPQPNGVHVTGTLTTNGGGIPNGAENVYFDLLPGRCDIVPHPTVGQGMEAWMDLTALAPDFTVQRFTFEFDERTKFGA